MPAAEAPPKANYDYVTPLRERKGYSYDLSERKEKEDYNIPSFQGTQSSEVIMEIPAHLCDVKEKIENSRHMLSYKYNWDDNGALPINPLIFERASRFLESYADRIYDVCKKILITPEIVPVNDGSIDLEWTLDNASFLINFKNAPEEIAFYYGEFKENGNVIFDTNGQINTSVVKDKFASYLSDLSEETNPA